MCVKNRADIGSKIYVPFVVAGGGESTNNFPEKKTVSLVGFCILRLHLECRRLTIIFFRRVKRKTPETTRILAGPQHFEKTREKFFFDEPQSKSSKSEKLSSAHVGCRCVTSSSSVNSSGKIVQKAGLACGRATIIA